VDNNVLEITARRPTVPVAAVLVHYGDPGRTIRAVLSHDSLGIFSGIIVVANDLSPRPDELRNVPCTWLVPARNLGFGDACQMAAMSCSADIYAFFNAHVTISKSAVERCLTAFDVADVGIASPYFYYSSRTQSWNSRHAYDIRSFSRILRIPVNIPPRPGSTQAMAADVTLVDNEWALGAGMFCRREIVADVGWDGSFFLGHEDIDIGLRAKKGGWRVVVASPAVAFHTGESTRTKSLETYYSVRNSLWFAKKHHYRGVPTLLTALILLRLGRLAAADVLRSRHPRHASAAMRGLLHGWRLRPEDNSALPGEPLWPTRSQ
jgi:N-acetylglucosaminyl-diphospho-decaprenol L-rhamnosyltransferase